MKKFLVLVSFLIVMICISSCNYQMVDLTYNFDYAYIKLPTGEVIEGEVQAWRDYEDGDQLQVTINDVTYLTHASNVCLISHYYYESPDEMMGDI